MGINAPPSGQFLIGELLGNGSVGTVTFNSLGTFKSLYFEALLRSNTLAASTTLHLSFNGDAGANYDYTLAGASGDTPAANTTRASGVIVLGSIPGANATANVFGFNDGIIPAYLSAVPHKMSQGGNSLKFGESADTDFQRRPNMGFWRNAAPITSVTIACAAGQFTTGSYVRLYGKN
jgi:hypothetical protein